MLLSLTPRPVLIVLLLLSNMVGHAQSNPTLPIPVLTELQQQPVPKPMQSCAVCHPDKVSSFLAHGMSASLGAERDMPLGKLDNSHNGSSYRIHSSTGKTFIDASFAGGGSRRQQIVGHIGAGIKARSWVGAELDVGTGKLTDRLFFTSVESSRGHGLSLAPFAIYSDAKAFGLPLTAACLGCHSDSQLPQLEQAATPVGASQPDTAQIYPANHLGSTALQQIQPLSCSACHGDVSEHPARMVGNIKPEPGASVTDNIGLKRLGQLSASQQLDVCGRCHLQGEVRIDLVQGRTDPDAPLMGQIPVLINTAADDDFRFVSQLERLALSACFQNAEALTCSSCHQPHQAVAAQGPASFDQACLQCHAPMLAPHSEQTVAQVSGQPQRSETGCVDCHMRRSTPFDLPHVRSVDHHVRRRISLPETTTSHRAFTDADGELKLFPDPRLATVLHSAAGQRWQQGIMAMGNLAMGRMATARERFATFPEPGTQAARQPSAPAGLQGLENNPEFHTLRGLALMSNAQVQPALAAFSDALLLDQYAAGARMHRARLSLDSGDLATALRDSQFLIEHYPEAEQPWDFRVLVAERVGRTGLAITALENALARWPANADNWWKLGLLLRQGGDQAGHDHAMQQVRRLQPELLQ